MRAAGGAGLHMPDVLEAAGAAAVGDPSPGSALVRRGAASLQPGLTAGKPAWCGPATSGVSTDRWPSRRIAEYRYAVKISSRYAGHDQGA